MKLQAMTMMTLILVLSSVPNGNAAESATAALSENYAERVPARLGHGLMNTLFGWTDFGIAPYTALQDGSGGGDAFGRALTQPFATTFLGLWDLLTFWVPGETGRSMAVPRHVWMSHPKKPQPTGGDDTAASVDMDQDE